MQYAQDGSIINSWDLDDKSVGSEEGSDGIYFTSNSGNVIHLSGHYAYVQVIENRWTEAKKECGVSSNES